MTAVNYLWNPINDNIVEEFDDVGNTIAEYTTEPDQYGDVISQFREGQETFYHTDGQGSTLALTDAIGEVTDTYAYSAFGEVTQHTGTTVNPFQYIGQKQYYRDSETGEYDVRRRQFSTLNGRWLSLDPLLAMDKYVYARNTPVTQFDPSGLLSWSNVSVKNESFLSVNPCGEYNWTIRWKVDDKDDSIYDTFTANPKINGYIIQKVTIRMSLRGCEGDPGIAKKPNHKCGGSYNALTNTTTTHYYEIWKVFKGDIYYDADKTPPTKKDTDEGYDDKFSLPKQPDTKGCQHKMGEAVFVTSLQGIEGLVSGGVADAGWLFSVCDLPGREGVTWESIKATAAKGSQSPKAVDRYIHVNWNCCSSEECKFGDYSHGHPHNRKFYDPDTDCLPPAAKVP